MEQPETVCTVPENLSRIARKREAFAEDPYFRDAWDDLTALRGRGEEARAPLFEVAPLVLRPDTIATRGGRRVLEAVRRAGFVPVASAVFRFDRRVTREIWRYQLNIATRERVDVMDMIMPVGRSLYVLLRGEGTPLAPACTRLSTLKGPSLPAERHEHHLRRIAGPAQASVLTYVHVADEPADIVRELGVLFDRAERLRLLTAASGTRDRSEPVHRALAEVEAETPAADLTPGPAFDRLERLIADRAGRGPVWPVDAPERSLARLSSLVSTIRAGRGRDWRAVLGLVDHLGLDWPHWDRVAVAAELSARHIDGPPVIPDIGTGTRPAGTREPPSPHQTEVRA
ncbi:hypothetical protein GCM10017673_35840 [Streptosporangium violaceochromogenes]|nr:hypothetical protein GCM10017673_35840 [Streptosporangium violaceochromogenes]